MSQENIELPTAEASAGPTCSSAVVERSAIFLAGVYLPDHVNDAVALHTIDDSVQLVAKDWLARRALRVARPVEEGWYWYRKDDQHDWSIFEVWCDGGQRWCSPSRRMVYGESNFVSNFDGEWYGPLMTPMN